MLILCNLLQQTQTGSFSRVGVEVMRYPIPQAFRIAIRSLSLVQNVRMISSCGDGKRVELLLPCSFCADTGTVSYESMMTIHVSGSVGDELTFCFLDGTTVKFPTRLAATHSILDRWIGVRDRSDVKVFVKSMVGIPGGASEILRAFTCGCVPCYITQIRLDVPLEISGGRQLFYAEKATRVSEDHPLL